jgi:hypothetical protein
VSIIGAFGQCHAINTVSQAEERGMLFGWLHGRLADSQEKGEHELRKIGKIEVDHRNLLQMIGAF